MVTAMKLAGPHCFFDPAGFRGYKGRLGGLHLIQGSADRRAIRAGGRHERLGNGGYHIRPGDPGRDLEHHL